MLANNYSNLYESEYYRIKTNYFQHSNDLVASSEFQQRFALANILYIESKKHIAFSSIDSSEAEVFASGESNLIKAILYHDETIIEILREAEEVEKATTPEEKFSSLAASIKVCENHLEKITKIHK